MLEITNREFRAADHRGPLPEDAIPVYLVTDCRSLYDCMVSLTPPQTEEKRVAIDICSLREQVPAAMVRWTPTQEQWADFLTKIQDLSRFLELLAAGRLRLAVVAREG